VSKLINLKETLTAIDPSKKCLSFLSDRILSDSYRGIHVSQHFRYDMNDIVAILNELYKIAGDGLLKIRTTDNSKRPMNTADENNYAMFVNNVNAAIKKGGQDSVRKNIFPDMHRMGLIDRYDSNGIKKDSYDNGIKQYVSLTDAGKRIIDPMTTYFDRYILYTSAINKLTNDLPTEILDIVIQNGYLYEDEFMFFVTFIGKTLNNVYYTKDMINELLSDYRSIGRYQRKAVVNIIREYCNPKNFSGDKTNKRDFHNWKNETQQIITLLSQTIYYTFDNGNERLSPRIDERLLFSNNDKLLRSLDEKNEYFKKHGVAKKYGYELHHIVPISWATSREEFKLLDSWKNMIYIDGRTHSTISQQNNIYFKLHFNSDDIVLSSLRDTNIYCRYNDNVLYNRNNKELMIEYNYNILNSTNN
jgi:hypothetical protein